MKCFICQGKLKTIKEIKSVNISECDKCKLAFLNKNIKSEETLYSLNNYQKEEKKLRQRIVKLGKLIIAYINQGRLLDIGAGFGLFSLILTKLGDFRVETLDSSIYPYYLKKVGVNFIHHQINYQEFLKKKNNKKYDLLLMIDILEHFKNPLAILKKTRKLMKDNSYLVIQTPNYQSLMAKICVNWSWWMIEDHKVVFSSQSIKKILNLTGYQIVYYKTYEDWFDFKKNLDGNFSGIKNLLIRKVFKIFFLFLFIPCYFLLRHLLWYWGYGGAIFLIATRYNIKNE